MTTAAEAIALTDCRDLRIKLETAERKIAELEKTKFNLNKLIDARDKYIATLEADNDELRAKLAAAQAGELDALELHY